MSSQPLIREHQVSDAAAMPYAVAVTDDSAVWATLAQGDAVVRRAADGSLTTIPLGEGGRPLLLAATDQDTVWVTEAVGNRLVQVGPEGVRAAVPVPTPEAHPFGIATTGTGELWFTEMASDLIGHVDAHGRVREFPTGAAGGMPSMIACADDAVWFTLNQAHAVGCLRVDHEQVEILPLPTQGAGPVGITAAPDGAGWFVQIGAGLIGRVDAAGTLVEHALPDRQSKPHAIAADPAGGCWFTLWGSNQVGHIGDDGAITLADLPTPDSQPHGLAVAPDGTVWVALEPGRLAEVSPQR